MAVKEIGFDDLPGLVNKELGTSDWHEVTQEDINKFADVTLDHQWIHIDRQRAEKESPYGATIAHGYYTLSLIPHLMSQIWKAKGVAMGVNYGLNKVRFPAPVIVGKKVRATATLAEISEIKGGVQLQTNVQIEVEDSEKPACVAECVFRWYKG